MAIPESFIQAFAIFFVGGAIRRYRGDNRKHSFLVHPSQKIADHRVVVDKINSLRQNWINKAKLQLDGKQDRSYVSLKRMLENAYNSKTDLFTKFPATIFLHSILLFLNSLARSDLVNEKFSLSITGKPK